MTLSAFPGNKHLVIIEESLVLTDKPEDIPVCFSILSCLWRTENSLPVLPAQTEAIHTEKTRPWKTLKLRNW